MRIPDTKWDVHKKDTIAWLAYKLLASGLHFRPNAVRTHFWPDPPESLLSGCKPNSDSFKPALTDASILQENHHLVLFRVADGILLHLTSTPSRLIRSDGPAARWRRPGIRHRRSRRRRSRRGLGMSQCYDHGLCSGPFKRSHGTRQQRRDALLILARSSRKPCFRVAKPSEKYGSRKESRGKAGEEFHQDCS